MDRGDVNGRRASPGPSPRFASRTLPTTVRACLRSDWIASKRLSTKSIPGKPIVAAKSHIVRAFRADMETIQEPDDLDGWAQYHEFMFPQMRRFLQSLPDMEANR